MKAFAPLALLLTLWSHPAFPTDSPSWTVDPTLSTLTFRYSEDGTEMTGGFSEFSAEIEFDADQPEVTTAVVRVATDSLDLDDAFKESVLATSPLFDSEKFPLALFRLTHLTPDPGDEAGIFHIDGILTIKGRERPVRTRTSLEFDGERAEANGSLTVSRRDYLLRDDALESLVSLGDDVTITFHLVADRTQ